jgi:hypothetical protein
VVPMWFPVKFPVVCSGVPGGFECSSPWFLPVEALVVSSGFPCGFQWSSPSRFLQPAGSDNPEETTKIKRAPAGILVTAAHAAGRGGQLVVHLPRVEMPLEVQHHSSRDSTI